MLKRSMGLFDWLKRNLFAAEYAKVEKLKLKAKYDLLEKKVHSNYGLIMRLDQEGRLEKNGIEDTLLQVILAGMQANAPGAGGPFLSSPTNFDLPPSGAPSPLENPDQMAALIANDPAFQSLLSQMKKK